MKITSPQTSSTLTTRQIDILVLLFRFRFLSRPQIQQLLNHKDHRLIQLWLNTLTGEGYLIRYYKYQSRNDPAIYSLGKAAQKCLKDSGRISSPELLKRIRKEPFYSETFREGCLYLTDLYLRIKEFSEQQEMKLTYLTKNDLYEVSDLITPSPSAYFSLKANHRTRQYFVELLIGSVKVMKRRIEQYVEYYLSDDWQENEQTTFPEIVLICQNLPLVRGLTNYIDQEFEERPNFSILSREQDIIELLPKKKARGA